MQKYSIFFLYYIGEIMATLGDRIKQRRTQLALSQYDLAREAEVRRERIAELETNRRFTIASDALKRLALALRCSADWLIGLYDDDVSEQKPAAVALVGA